ncbi:MAG: LexA family protein [Anaerolineae bacterium]
MIIKLTPRQQAFLDKLIELYREWGRPVHYSVIGRMLGVNRFSAYDMMKLLERKGYVASEYVLAEGRSGPGRSSIAFYPTERAKQEASPLVSWSIEDLEWRRLREKLLARLQKRERSDDELLTEILANVPQVKSPLLYCTEMITALLINLRALRDRAASLSPLPSLQSLLPSGELGLGTLAGLSLGSALARRPDNSLLHKLLLCTRRYQSHLRHLSEEHKDALSDFLEEALSVIDLRSRSG